MYLCARPPVSVWRARSTLRSPSTHYWINLFSGQPDGRPGAKWTQLDRRQPASEANISLLSLAPRRRASIVLALVSSLWPLVSGRWPVLAEFAPPAQMINCSPGTAGQPELSGRPKPQPTGPWVPPRSRPAARFLVGRQGAAHEC